jgi:imidazolonepropionase
VFLEDHAFTVDQSRRILQAGLQYGMKPKIHVDQFNSMGGVEMAIDVGAVSADHLEVTTDEDIERLANSGTIGVLMPAVNFNLGLPNFARGRNMVDAGVAIALATDLNPGSAPCFSMPLTMAIGTRYMKISPAEAINAATINAAHAIDMADKVGSIELGKQADLLILDTADYRHLMYLLGNNLVKTVIKKGQIVNFQVPA